MSPVKKSTVKKSAAKESTVKGSAAKESTVKESTTKESTVKGSAVKESTDTESAVKNSAAKESTVKGSAAKESTVKESAVKESMVKDFVVKDLSLVLKELEAKAKSKAIEVDNLRQILNYRVTVFRKDDYVIVGKFQAFDRHMNLVLADCDEYRTKVFNKYRKKNELPPEDKKRGLGRVLLRGRLVMTIFTEGPPPVDPVPPLQPPKAKQSMPRPNGPAGRGVRPPFQVLPHSASHQFRPPRFPSTNYPPSVITPPGVPRFSISPSGILYGVPPSGAPPSRASPSRAPPSSVPPFGAPPSGAPPSGVPPPEASPSSIPPSGDPSYGIPPSSTSFSAISSSGVTYSYGIPPSSIPSSGVPVYGAPSSPVYGTPSPTVYGTPSYGNLLSVVPPSGVPAYHILPSYVPPSGGPPYILPKFPPPTVIPYSYGVRPHGIQYEGIPYLYGVPPENIPPSDIPPENIHPEGVSPEVIPPEDVLPEGSAPTYQYSAGYAPQMVMMPDGTAYSTYYMDPSVPRGPPY